MTGATIGATLSFLLARWLFRFPLSHAYQEKLRYFNEEIKQRGAYYLLSLRFFALFPFFS